MNQNKNRTVESDIFTALLALATGAVLATSVYICYLCYSYYGTIFKIAEAVR